MPLKFFNEKDTKIAWDKMDTKALERLDAARELADAPFVITSTYRTPEHTLEVGGLNGDAHTQIPCKTFDIAYNDTYHLFKIVQGCFLAGFDRIGINPFNHHVHVDDEITLPTPRLWIETPESLMIKALTAKGYTVTKNNG